MGRPGAVDGAFDGAGDGGGGLDRAAGLLARGDRD